MSKTQSFCLTGATEVVTIPIQHANGQDLVCWDAIVQVFPGVKSVKNGDVSVPHYIKHVPDEILTVVLSNTTDYLRAESSGPSTTATSAFNSGQTVGATDARAERASDPSGVESLVEGLRVTSVSEDRPSNDTDTHSTPIDSSILPPASPFGSETTLKTALSFIKALKRASERAKEVNGKAPPQEENGAMASVIKLLEAADIRQEEMKQLVERQHQEMTKQAEKHHQEMTGLAERHHQEVQQFQEAANAKSEEIKQLQSAAVARQEKMILLQNQAYKKQLEMEQLALTHHEEITHMQSRTLEQVRVLQTRVQAVFTQTFELHEYPIPRLFIVLPQYPSGWNILEPFTEKYRLYFLCECGEHTKTAGSSSNIPHEIHLAKHEGYEIARSTEFFLQYGTYLLTILKMLKFGISVASVAVPAVAHLVNSDALDHAAKGLQHLKECIGPGMDQVISKIEKESVDGVESVENFADQMENKEALEGADLRKLETFLKNKDENKVLGNLYRTVTDEGHVKWVCVDHYRENYNQTAVAAFRRTVKSLEGSFDENNGLVKVQPRSRESANQLYSALRNSRSVHELDIDFDWACTATDLKALVDALSISAIAILHVDVQQFRPSFTNKLSSISTRYEVLHRLMDLPNMRSIHIVLPKDLNNLSDFTPKRPSHLRKLSFAMVVGPKVRIHAEIPETGCMTTTWHLWTYWMGSKGAKALADALNILTRLHLSYNSIGDHGAQALSGVLKSNSTLTTLELESNSIGDNGAQALSEALKTNSTLTTLDLNSNSIGNNGAQALSEALKRNSTLTNLNLGFNSIGDQGAQALSEALKVNSTLTTLRLWYNSIGDNGAQALSDALKINSTLASLELKGNSIGDHGAQALSAALKTNFALDWLNLEHNSFGAKGAQALDEAEKTNKTVSIWR
ncbi:hypothetical protein EC968_000052 [Mortierella alpina]|nr:hypothetical protein EC968_000052 [Mortierella alpina]